MTNIEWNFYDRQLPSLESRRNLPHIEMRGALTFVTFRLGDSMPQQVVERWHEAVDEWMTANNLTGRSVDEVLESSFVTHQLKDELRRFKNRRRHGHLDDCHGACVLKNRDLREFVSQSLLCFNGDRYDLERFVIMPNHVHVLIQMRDEFLLRKTFREIQRYSARQINQHSDRSGELWQGEPFDHIVRNESQFEYLQRYIDENPVKAR